MVMMTSDRYWWKGKEMEAALVEGERNGNNGRPLKTIDGDYGDGYYGRKGVKRATILGRESKEDTACMREEQREEAKGRGRRGRHNNMLMARCAGAERGLGTRARRTAHCGGMSLGCEADMCKDTDGCASKRPSDAGAT